MFFDFFISHIGNPNSDSSYDRRFGVTHSMSDKFQKLRSFADAPDTTLKKGSFIASLMCTTLLIDVNIIGNGFQMIT